MPRQRASLKNGDMVTTPDPVNLVKYQHWSSTVALAHMRSAENQGRNCIRLPPIIPTMSESPKCRADVPINTYSNSDLKRWIIFLKTLETKGIFSIWSHHKQINVFISSFRFLWIPMLWVYGHYKYVNSHSAESDFSRQYLTHTDVRFWRLTLLRSTETYPQPKSTCPFHSSTA